MARVLLLAALLLTFGIAPASACASRLPPSATFDVRRLFGKSQPQVEALLGKGTPARQEGGFNYEAKGYERLNIDYGDQLGYAKVKGKVRSVTL